MAEHTTEDDDVGHTAGGSRVIHSRAADRGDGTQLSIAVIEAVAEAKGVEPVEMRETLYEAVDPDALDRLFTGGTDGEFTGRVVFELSAHEVTVQSNGDILVRQVEPR